MNCLLLFIDLFNRYDAYRRESIQINIEGLTSLEKLKLAVFTSEIDLSINNLPSLRKLFLSLSGTINENILTRLLDQIPHIKELYLDGKLSYFNLDNFVNLRVLSLGGIINENFNFELFKNLCFQLECIIITFVNNDEKTFSKLFIYFEK